MMKIFLIVILLLLSLPAQAGTLLTTTGTGGSCASGASFVGGVAPSLSGGDRVIIANGANLDVPLGTTCWLGDYPTDDTGNVALQGVGTTGTGTLSVEGTFRYSGPVRQPNGNWVFTPGSTLTYDATGASSPPAALYTWQISTVSSQANALLSINGTSGAHVTINSASNINSGGFTTGNFNDGGRIVGSWADFSYVGPATSSGIAFTQKFVSSAATFSLTNVTLDHSGAIGAGSTLGAASSFILNGVLITNSYNTAHTVYVDGTQAGTITGTRSFTNSVINGGTFINESTPSGQTGFVVQNNMFVNLLGFGATVLSIKGGQQLTSFDSNLLFGFFENSFVANTTTNMYVFRAADPSTANDHPVYSYMATTLNASISGSIFDSDINTSAGDMIEFSSLGSPTGNFLATNNLFLPNSIGGAVGNLINNSQSGTQTFTISFNHNTAAINNCGVGVCGVGFETSTSNSIPANAVTSIANNILWRPTSGTGIFVQSSPSSTIANGAVALADYNDASNITGSMYSTPVNQYATTPGVHDFAVNPGFVDTSRNFFTFDTGSIASGALGNPTATAWVNGTVYSAGDRVSASTSGFFGAATFNYCALVAHTAATATNKPGSGSVWSESWAPATYCDIRTSTLAGTPAIAQLLTWVKAGYRFTNQTLHNAGNDSLDLGAEPFLPSNTGGFFMLMR